VQTTEANAFVQQGFHDTNQTVALNHGMISTTVHKENDSFGVVKNGFIVWPASTHDHRLDKPAFGEAFSKQCDTGIEFVVAGPVTGLPSNENDFWSFLGGPICGTSRKFCKEWRCGKGSQYLTTIKHFEWFLSHGVTSFKWISKNRKKPTRQQQVEPAFGWYDTKKQGGRASADGTQATPAPP
jgi:hypothetical protein